MPDLSYTRVLPQSAEPTYDLTVVTVCRNVLPALKRTTASVLGQKAVYPNVSIEHVIVDGASTDGTPEWLAEMKAQGKIESYVSEPDRGIYDAMNKGINLARGRVLLFLNADDVFTHVDIAPCIAPILQGQSRMTAAITRIYDDIDIELKKPDEKALYFICPICHQAFFAEASLYREFGGYRSDLFRCTADRDFMLRAIAREGFPPIINSVVSDMPLGGFSANSKYRFCDELIALLALNKDAVLEHCRNDSAYTDATVVLLLNHCIALRKWQVEFSRDISAQLIALQELCLALQGITTSRTCKAAMRYAAGPYLSTLRKQKQCTLYQWFRIRRYRERCALPVGHPYHETIPSAAPSICSTLQYYLMRLFGRAQHD